MRNESIKTNKIGTGGQAKTHFINNRQKDRLKEKFLWSWFTPLCRSFNWGDGKPKIPAVTKTPINKTSPGADKYNSIPPEKVFDIIWDWEKTNNGNNNNSISKVNKDDFMQDCWFNSGASEIASKNKLAAVIIADTAKTCNVSPETVKLWWENSSGDLNEFLLTRAQFLNFSDDDSKRVEKLKHVLDIKS